ncbi:hypothetical protein [Roseibium sp. LAB1]
MTGLRSRHTTNEPATNEPATNEPEHRSAGGGKQKAFSPFGLFRPGSANICLCHLLVLTVLLSPIALGIAVIYAEPEGRWLQAHYHYLRTTIALLVIGLSTGGLMILLGASSSSALMLAGLGVCTVTVMLSSARSLLGLFSALRGSPLRNHRSYFI